MPLIPSYIARFRTHSQSTAATASSTSGSHSGSTAGPPTPGPEFIRLALDPPALDPAHPAQIARKIHPDLGALLNENPIGDGAIEFSGPRPPKGHRSRSAGQLVSNRPEAVQEQETEVASAQETDVKAPGGDVPNAPATPRLPFLSRILSTPILGGERTASSSNPGVEPDTEGLPTQWSTFGRRRVRSSTAGEFGLLHRRSGSKSSGQSKVSKRRTPRGSAPATPSTTRAPSQVQVSASDTHPSQSDSPAGTISSSSGSKPHSQHSQSIRSRRHPQSYPEPIPDVELHSSNDPQTPTQQLFQSSSMSPFTPVSAIVSPRPIKPHITDSPQTFGRVTPKRRSESSKLHRDLGDAFSPPRTSTPPPEHYTNRFTREPPSTYPPRSRTRASGSGSTISFPSLPMKPFKRTQSRPRAEDVFQQEEQDRKPGAPGMRFGLGSFLSPEGNDANRRISADWSATEAVKNGDSGDGETWPATVSREIVRLSLRGRGGRGGVVPAFAEGRGNVGEVGTLEKGATKNPTLFGSTGEERHRFLRAGRRTNIDYAAHAQASSSTSQPLRPAYIVSPSPDPEGVDSNAGRTEPCGRDPTPPNESQIDTLSDPGPRASSKSGAIPLTPMSHGKRKIVESEDEAPPNELGIRSILLSRTKRGSDASHAPSSFRHAKRIRLSTPSHSPPYDHHSPHHSRAASPASRPPSSLRTLPVNPRTLSQSSIPLRAIVSPKPPSIDRRSAYHMRDPTLAPPRRQSTQWTGGARKDEQEGKRMFPLQGWAFIIGFLVFPLWWVAAAAPVGWGWGWRSVGVQDGKGVWTEEDLAAREVMEYDVAYTWRQRCRFMSLLGLFVYVPLVVLLAVFVPRM